jgi:hypothetical protein
MRDVELFKQCMVIAAVVATCTFGLVWMAFTDLLM